MKIHILTSLLLSTATFFLAAPVTSSAQTKKSGGRSVVKAPSERGVPKPVLETKNPEVSKPIAVPQPIPQIQPCNLVLAEAPAIRDLRAGMREQDFLELFAIDGVKRDYVFHKTNTEGVLEANILPAFPNRLYRAPASFRGISILKVKTFSGKVFYLEFTYEASEIKFANNAEFAESISKSLKLPRMSWVYDGVNGDLICKDFKVTVSDLMKSITLIDLATQREIKESEELKRETFKP